MRHLFFQTSRDFCESPFCPSMPPIRCDKYFCHIRCNDKMDVKKSKIWTFSYKVCKKGHTARISHENGTFQCHCISNIFMDCYADLNGNKVCKIISKTLCLAQIITALVGIVLNMVICYVFCKNVAIRKKNSNNLLFNQALVDLVNCIFYALPNSSFQLI